MTVTTGLFWKKQKIAFVRQEGYYNAMTGQEYIWQDSVVLYPNTLDGKKAMENYEMNIKAFHMLCSFIDGT